MCEDNQIHYLLQFMVLQHQDLTVTSEEKILNAILMWCMRAEELRGWEEVNYIISLSNPDLLFKDRLQSLDNLLPFVRFPLMSDVLLQKVCKLSLC